MSIAMQATPHAEVRCLRALSHTDFRPDLQAVTVPTLIVYGTADCAGHSRSIRAARRPGIAGSRLEIYEGAPHAFS